MIVMLNFHKKANSKAQQSNPESKSQYQGKDQMNINGLTLREQSKRLGSDVGNRPVRICIRISIRIRKYICNM